jgi:Skp family chaperone for outer membrane proteins
MKTRILAALVALAVVLPAAAQNATPKVDARQANQEARIQQGVQSGSLTGKEASKLEKGQDKVAQKEAKAKADGKVTKKERAKLAKSQDKQGKKIAKQKHDKQKQAPAT